MLVTPRDAMIEFEATPRAPNTSRGEEKKVQAITRVLSEEEKEELALYGSSGFLTDRRKNLAWLLQNCR